MKLQRKKLAVALAYALGITGSALLGTSAVAQGIKVDVTGSNVKRVEGEGALPVQVITIESIERQGVQTAAQVIERLAVNSTTGAITIASTEGNTAAGAAGASLRGLGTTRTLVLLNGRRVSNSAFAGGGIDLNTIPLSAIERIEVLTDGASAIYGSDAIAGVINFILRKEYQGAEAYASYGDSEHGGGFTGHYNAVAGFGDLATQKFNAFVTADYADLGGLRASQREFSKTAYIPGQIDKTSGNSVPANVSITGVGTRNPTGDPANGYRNPTCAPPFSFPTQASPFQCRFDYASVIDILPPQKIWTVLGRGVWQFSPDHQLFVEGNYADSKSTGRVSPSPISAATIFGGTPILIPATSPYYPHQFAQYFGIDGQPLNVAWRSLVLGPRTEDDETKYWRALVGLQGLAWGWDYNGAFTWNETKSSANYVAGWTRGSILQPILNSGQINVFSATLPADQLALLAPAVLNSPIQDNKQTAETFDLHASKEIYQLPAGPLALALGGSFERDTFEQTASEVANSGDIPGSGGTIADLPQVSRRTYAFFGELNIPIVTTLEGNVAVRYDHYSDFGSTTNPKVSLRWQPTKEYLMRGSYGKGFRAPQLPELFLPTQQGATGSNHDDPERCPFTHSSLDCQLQFNSLTGGNPALKPEKSTQWSVGGVWEPVAGNSIGLDYWNITVNDVVGTLGESTIFNNFAQWEAAGVIVRYPVDPTTPNLPGRINYLLQTNLNIQKFKVNGLDVNVNLRFPKLDWGQFSAYLNGTYYANWEQTDLNTGQLTNYAGQSTGGVAVVQAGVGFPGSLPRWKHQAAVNWDYGPWKATLVNNFIYSYQDDGGTREVGTYSLWDISGSYSGFKHFTLSAGIKNLIDTNPPFSIQGQAFQVGYDPTYADPRGRFYWGAIKFSWN